VGQTGDLGMDNVHPIFCPSLPKAPTLGAWNATGLFGRGAAGECGYGVAAVRSSTVGKAAR